MHFPCKIQQSLSTNAIIVGAQTHWLFDLRLYQLSCNIMQYLQFRIASPNCFERMWAMDTKVGSYPLLPDSWSSDSITVKNKKNILKSLSVYLRQLYNIIIPLPY